MGQAVGCCGSRAESDDGKPVHLKELYATESQHSARSSETLTDIQEGRSQALSWQITDEFTQVRVRSAPSFAADTITRKRQGATVHGVEIGGWVKLVDEQGYIAITDVSGKHLLQRVPKVGSVEEAGKMPMGAVISIKQDRCIDKEEAALEVEIITKTDEQVIVMPVEKPGNLYVVDIAEPVLLRRKTELDEEALRRRTEEVIALAADEDCFEDDSPVAKGAATEGDDSPVALSNADGAEKKPDSTTTPEIREKPESVEIDAQAEPCAEASVQASQSRKSRVTFAAAQPQQEWENSQRPVAKRTPKSLKSLISRDVLKRYERNALTVFSDDLNQSFCSNADVTPEPVKLASLSTKDLSDYMKNLKKNGKSLDNETALRKTV